MKTIERESSDSDSDSEESDEEEQKPAPKKGTQVGKYSKCRYTRVQNF